MNRFWAISGAFHAACAVAAGAFGAHALKGRLSAQMLEVFETGARYQMYHALGLLLLACLAGQGVKVSAAGGVMSAGIILFSGSLYALALSGQRALGAVTPVGGLCFLVAWGLLIFACVRS